MDIFVCMPLDDVQAARLRSIAEGHRLHLHGVIPDGETPNAAFLESEVVLGNPPPAWLAGRHGVCWIQLESVGFGEYLAIADRVIGDGVKITNLAGFFGEPVAETALAGVLAVFRGIDRVVDLRRANEWAGDDLRPDLRTLAHTRVVLFGYGSINRRLAALLEPFECHIERFGSDWSAARLDAAMTRADVVVSAAPDVDAARCVFSRERLARLPRTAIFANFGRGAVVDEEALADALAAESLRGAVIDVTNEEPLPKDHRFWRCPNLILTQHTGGGSVDEIDRKLDVFEDNFKRYVDGRPLAGLADFSRGY